MQAKAIAIFLYDLYVLGFYEINLNEFFCQTLIEYVVKSAHLFPKAIQSIFMVEFEGENAMVQMSAESFAKGFDLAQKLSVSAISASQVFDDFDQETINQIGDFSSGFSTYIIDVMEFLSNDALWGDNVYIKH